MKITTAVRGGHIWVGSVRPYETPAEFEALYLSLEGEELALFKSVCAQLPCAKAYAEANYRKYGWTEEMLAAGKIYTAAELPSPVPFFKRPWWCFENSYIHAEKMGLRYVEGLAVHPNGILLHAWNSTDGTDVLDYTWPLQHVNKYFGIELDIAKMKKDGIPPGILGRLHEREQEKRKTRT